MMHLLARWVVALAAVISLVVIAGAVLMPYVGLTVAYLYFDARVRAHLARDTVDDRVIMPAEIPAP